MTRDRRPQDPEDGRRARPEEVREAEEVREEVKARNPDPETRREAFEREVTERGEADAAADIGHDDMRGVSPDEDD